MQCDARHGYISGVHLLLKAFYMNAHNTDGEPMDNEHIKVCRVSNFLDLVPNLKNYFIGDTLKK